MIDIVKPVPGKKSDAIILHVRCLYSATINLTNNINMNLLRTNNINMNLLRTHEFEHLKSNKKSCSIHGIIKKQKNVSDKSLFGSNSFYSSLLPSSFIFWRT